MDLVKSLPAVDCTAENWQAQACELLKQHGFVRLRLNAEEMRCVRELYSAAQVAFDDGASRRALEVPPCDGRRLDARSGYVDDRRREFFELHPEVPHRLGEVGPVPAAHLLDCISRYAENCRARCYAMLRELAGGDQHTPVGRLIESELRHAERKAGSARRDGEGATSHGGLLVAAATHHPMDAGHQGGSGPAPAGFTTSMVRVYQYARSLDEGGQEDGSEGSMPCGEAGASGASGAGPLPSTTTDGGLDDCRDGYGFRARRPDDGDPHHDMGLLTLIPRSSFPGLDVQLPCPQPAGAAHAVVAHAGAAHAGAAHVGAAHVGAAPGCTELRPADTARSESAWSAAGARLSDHGPEWVRVEDAMEEDEAIVFGGLTLARLTGIRALYHRVCFQRKCRISAPYFQRPSLRVVLPASPGHASEEVCDYNEAIRKADEEDLLPDGTVLRRRERSSGWTRTPPVPVPYEHERAGRHGHRRRRDADHRKDHRPPPPQERHARRDTRYADDRHDDRRTSERYAELARSERPNWRERSPAATNGRTSPAGSFTGSYLSASTAPAHDGWRRGSGSHTGSHTSNSHSHSHSHSHMRHGHGHGALKGRGGGARQQERYSGGSSNSSLGGGSCNGSEYSAFH